MEYYAPDYKLHVPVSNMENDNTREALEKQMHKMFEALSSLEHAPNVQIQTGNPGTRRNPDGLSTWDDSDDETDADSRPQRSKRCHLAEYFDEDDASGDRMDTDRLGLKDFEEPPSDDDDGF
jgi:histone deacetylase 1/2